MPTTFQKLFNRWMSRNYETIKRELPMRDMLHSAYLTVYDVRRPYLPTPERFHNLMSEAYHRHMLREFNHNMRFVLPDPLFWMLADEDANMRLAFSEPSPRGLSDMSAYGMRKLFEFVKSTFSRDEFDIFRMAIVEQMSVKDIASITGKSKPEVRKVLDNIEMAIRGQRIRKGAKR